MPICWPARVTQRQHRPRDRYVRAYVSIMHARERARSVFYLYTTSKFSKNCLWYGTVHDYMSCWSPFYFLKKIELRQQHQPDAGRARRLSAAPDPTRRRPNGARPAWRPAYQLQLVLPVGNIQVPLNMWCTGWLQPGTTGEVWTLQPDKVGRHSSRA